MAISLEEFDRETAKQYTLWEREALEVEKQIDKALLQAIADNIVPNLNNPHFVTRYKFSNKISTPAKDLLRLKYGSLGWEIKENIDFKDALVHGYFDFFKKY